MVKFKTTQYGYLFLFDIPFLLKGGVPNGNESDRRTENYDRVKHKTKL